MREGPHEECVGVSYEYMSGRGVLCLLFFLSIESSLWNEERLLDLSNRLGVFDRALGHGPFH